MAPRAALEAVSASRALSEEEWYGRMSAAARLMLAYTTIVVHLSADGAVSFERRRLDALLRCRRCRRAWATGPRHR